MAEKEPGDERPSLELPSLGFGRKRRKAAPEDPDQAVTPEPAPAPDPVPRTEPAPTQRLDPVPAAPAAPPLFVDEVPATPPPAAAQPAHVDLDDEDDDEPTSSRRGQRREFELPSIGGLAASMVTGLLVGLLTVGATWASLRLCEVVQGTPSCGNPGFFLLLAIVVAMVLIGRTLLRAFGVPDPGSTSFLAMGVVAVVALLFLVDLLFLWWMVLVIPAVSLVAYALAHWVTTSFTEPVANNMHR